MKQQLSLRVEHGLNQEMLWVVWLSGLSAGL